MEALGAPAFHIYLYDYDKDGYFDIVMPSQLANEVIYLKNPGSTYWHKVWSIANGPRSSTQKDSLLKLDKW